jgi:hypothetical protein
MQLVMAFFAGSMAEFSSPQRIRGATGRYLTLF